MLATKQRRPSQASSRPPRLRASSRVAPPALSCVPTTSRASRMVSTCEDMAAWTISTYSSSHRLSTLDFRASPRGHEVTRRCVSSSPASRRPSGSTCGLPTTRCRAGCLAWQPAGWWPSVATSSRSQTSTSVSKKAQASASRCTLSSPNARRSVWGTCSKDSTATPVRKEERSGTMVSLGSQIMTLWQRACKKGCKLSAHVAERPSALAAQSPNEYLATLPNEAKVRSATRNLTTSGCA
mmetsp:Transcript_89438/g.248410  ORF Transcript_89438/g.248410 Transcript_89438/m.248410 type:complete len:239 (+) Transcript_89438:728-1444(+)